MRDLIARIRSCCTYVVDHGGDFSSRCLADALPATLALAGLLLGEDDAVRLVDPDEACDRLLAAGVAPPELVTRLRAALRAVRTLPRGRALGERDLQAARESACSLRDFVELAERQLIGRERAVQPPA